MEETIDITPGDVTGSQVVKYCVTKAEIAKLAEKYKEVPTDLTIRENYELCRLGSAEIRSLRVEVEKRRKELKADALAWGKKVDGTAKEITALLLEIETPMATAKKDHDNAIELAKREAALAEEKRIDGIATRIATIQALPAAHISSTAEVIFKAINEHFVDSENHEIWAQEFADKAGQAIYESSNKLQELYDMKVQQENMAAQAAAAEEARLKAEEEARIQREIEIAEEQKMIAAERAAMEAERQKMAKAAEELAAIQKAKDEEREALAEAERKRLAAEQAAKDTEMEAERARLAEEIEQLKKDKAPEPEPEPAPAVKPTGGQEYSPDMKASANAMLKVIGNKGATKELFEAIVRGDIPNIKFNGEI